MFWLLCLYYFIKLYIILKVFSLSQLQLEVQDMETDLLHLLRQGNQMSLISLFP